MLKIGNTPIGNNYGVTFSGKNNKGYAVGTIDDIPTNNTYYRKIWKWPDGRILNNDEINENKLDTNFETRDYLEAEGLGPINKEEIKGYYYEKDKIIHLEKCIYGSSTFGKDYFDNELTGEYYFKYAIYKLIIGNKLKNTNSRSLTYRFFNELLYKNYMKQISTIATYVKTQKNGYDILVSYYKYGAFTISTQIDNTQTPTNYKIIISK
jgi:hypothetical protein